MRLRFTIAAQADIVGILSDSEVSFGSAARKRYERLIKAALRDISSDPLRLGSIPRPELGGEHGRSWHLKGSRERARGTDGIVRQPRHLIIYKIEGADLVVIIRVLHDAMEVRRHLPAIDDDWNALA